MTPEGHCAAHPSPYALRVTWEAHEPTVPAPNRADTPRRRIRRVRGLHRSDRLRVAERRRRGQPDTAPDPGSAVATVPDARGDTIAVAVDPGSDSRAAPRARGAATELLRRRPVPR